MKQLRSLLLFLIVVGGFSHVKAEDQGAIALVNAVGLSSPTEILADGRSIKPEGFEPGAVTSFVALPAKPLSLSARNGALVSASTSVTPSPSQSNIIVFYLLEREREDGSIIQELKMETIPSLRRGTGFQQRLLFVGSERSVVFRVNDHTVELRPGIPSEPLRLGEITIADAAGREIATSAQAEAGAFLIVISPKSGGGFLATSIRDNFITFGPAAETATN